MVRGLTARVLLTVVRFIIEAVPELNKTGAAENLQVMALPRQHGLLLFIISCTNDNLLKCVSSSRMILGSSKGS